MRSLQTPDAPLSLFRHIVSYLTLWIFLSKAPPLQRKSLWIFSKISNIMESLNPLPHWKYIVACINPTDKTTPHHLKLPLTWMEHPKGVQKYDGCPTLHLSPTSKLFKFFTLLIGINSLLKINPHSNKKFLLTTWVTNKKKVNWS